jgi:hypothetical protein
MIIETKKRVAKPNPKRSRTVLTTGCKEISIFLEGQIILPFLFKLTFKYYANHQRSTHLAPSLSQLAAILPWAIFLLFALT